MIARLFPYALAVIAIVAFVILATTPAVGHVG